MIKNWFNILLISSLIGLTACSQKSDTEGTGDNAPALPNVAYIGGSPATKVASNDPIFLESNIILDEIDNPVADNYEFTVYGEATGLVDFPIEVSNDGLTFSASIKTYSKDGKIKFYAKVPTKKTTNMPTPYRITAKPTLGNVLGRFFVTVTPGPVAIVGEIKGTTYEDEFPYNNKKDPDEKYTIRGDGNTIVNVRVGPVLDAFANRVDAATIRLSVDRGQVVSPSPASVGIEGDASFSIQSALGTESITMLAEAMEGNQVLSNAIGTLQMVRPRLVSNETGDYGNVFVNETQNKTFVVQNTGNTSATNVTFVVGNPFSITGGTCFTGMRLRPGDTCSVVVSFTGGISSVFEAELRITGSPTDVQEATIVKTLTATAVKRAFMAVAESAILVPQQTCGIATDYITYVQNQGDLPGLNFRATTPIGNVSGLPKDTEIVLPPLDAFLNPDLNEVVNCGNTLLPNRKCRVIIRHTPQSLYDTQVLTGSIAIDGQDPISMSIRVSSKVGDPFGTIPLTLTDITTGQPKTSMDLGTTNVISVRAGPVVDACNNPINNTPVIAEVTAGSVSAPLNTANGFATFSWYGSADINDVGTRFINVRSGVGSAIGSAAALFRGIKLVQINPETALGQVLRVTYNPAKYYELRVKNEGTIDATNVSWDIDDAGGAWLVPDLQFNGGCNDSKLLVGETCTIRYRYNPMAANLGNLTAKITVSSTEAGQNESVYNLTANSVNPPTISFTGAPTINMGSYAAGSRPESTITLNNTSSTTTVQALVTTVAAPFQKVSETCSANLAPNSSCTIVVKLPIDVRGSYNASIQASSEYVSASANITTTIVSNLASGIIPMTMDKTSVPANPSSPSAIITVSVGPIKDAYGNNVVAGTPVQFVADKGLMSIDTDNDGVAIANTGSGGNEGRVTFTIRARSISEISNFTILASVINAQETIASGSVSGSFTGALLSFTEDSTDFGQVAVGALEFKTIRLRNQGNERAQNIVWNTSSTDFSLSGQGSCTALNPGTFCDVTVLVNPVQAGNLTGSINVNATGNGIISDSIGLSAQAVEAAKIVAGNTYDAGLKDYSIKTLSMDYIPGIASTATFKVRNIGQENLVDFASSISVRPSEFSLSVPTSCSTLGLNQECTITVNFNPTAIVGATVTGEITLTGESPSRVTVAKVNVNLTSPQLNFILKQASLPRNSCGSYQVQLQNASEVGVGVGSTTTFNLTRTGGTGTFYSNASCTNVITGVTINAGQSSSAVFYYRGITDGDHTLIAANTTKTVQTLTRIYTVPQISPSSITLAPNDTRTFTTNNGVTPFVYQVLTPGGGTINSSSGDYTAPVTPGTYTVRVTDNIGNTSDATVVVEGIKLMAGRHFWCSLSVGVLKCIGENAFGQYGQNSVIKGFYNESVPVGKISTITHSLGSNVKNLYTGGYNSCMTRQDNRLYCQGANHVGAIGDGTLVDKATPTAVSGSFTALDGTKTVAVGWGLHTCAINSSNVLYCWGKNDRGQLGKNSTTLSYALPQSVSFASDFTRIVAGVNFTCGLRSNGTVLCWGDNTYGQLGDNTTTSQSSGTSTTVLQTSGSLALSNIRDISAGRYHVCAVDNSNNLYCWGRNQNGQIGNNTVTNALRPIAIATDVKTVSAGGSHTCLMKNTNNQVQCWGNNAQGQLGLGNLNVTRIPTNLSGVNGTISELVTGENYTCLIQNGSQVRCVGENTYGVLGNNDLNNTTSLSTVNPNNGTINCGVGASYESSTGSCKCSSSSNLYGYESRTCSAASLTNLYANLLEYGQVGTNHPVGFAPKQASLFYSNVPVNYSKVGTGVLSYSRIITDNDALANIHNNNLTRGNLDYESVTAAIGSVSATVNYRLYKPNCDQYFTSYGDLTNGAQTLIDGGGNLYSGFCRFVGGLGYTYTQSADYTRGYYQKVVPYGNNMSTQCAPNTTIVWQSGVLTNGTESCNFGYEDLQRTGFLIDNSICSPLPSGSPTATGQYNCR